jgi:hypothetical protein
LLLYDLQQQQWDRPRPNRRKTPEPGQIHNSKGQVLAVISAVEAWKCRSVVSTAVTVCACDTPPPPHEKQHYTSSLAAETETAAWARRY